MTTILAVGRISHGAITLTTHPSTHNVLIVDINDSPIGYAHQAQCDDCSWAGRERTSRHWGSEQEAEVDALRHKKGDPDA